VVVSHPPSTIIYFARVFLCRDEDIYCGFYDVHNDPLFLKYSSITPSTSEYNFKLVNYASKHVRKIEFSRHRLVNIGVSEVTAGKDALQSQ